MKKTAKKITEIPLKSSEDEQQQLLFEWAATQINRLRGIEMMFAIPNGGHRHIRVAMKLKRTGVKPGVMDVFLPFASGKYHGLWIEMKWGKNKTSEAQDRYLQYLKEAGYMAGVCYSWQDAAKLIESYYDLSRI